MRHHLAGKCRRNHSLHPTHSNAFFFWNRQWTQWGTAVRIWRGAKKDQRDEALVTCLPKDPAMYNIPLKSPDMLSPIQICLQSWNSFLAGTDRTGPWQPRWVPFFRFLTWLDSARRNIHRLSDQFVQFPGCPINWINRGHSHIMSYSWCIMKKGFP